MEQQKFFQKMKKFVEKNGISKFQEYEDRIFGKLDKKTRASMELKRLDLALRSVPEIYVEYYDEIKRLEELLKVANFDSTVIDDVYCSIVRMQMKCEQDIRLYTAVGLVLDEPSKEDEFRKGL